MFKLASLHCTIASSLNTFLLGNAIKKTIKENNQINYISRVEGRNLRYLKTLKSGSVTQVFYTFKCNDIELLKSLDAYS